MMPLRTTRELFDMVLVQLMLGSHVLRLLSHLVQEVASLALRKRKGETRVKKKKVSLAICLYFLPHEPVCGKKDRCDKEARIDR